MDTCPSDVEQKLAEWWEGARLDPSLCAMDWTGLLIVVRDLIESERRECAALAERDSHFYGLEAKRCERNELAVVLNNKAAAACKYIADKIKERK